MKTRIYATPAVKGLNYIKCFLEEQEDYYILGLLFFVIARASYLVCLV